jgi:hypothetical protein
MCILRILCSLQLYLQLIAGHLRDKPHQSKCLIHAPQTTLQKLASRAQLNPDAYRVKIDSSDPRAALFPDGLAH